MTPLKEDNAPDRSEVNHFFCYAQRRSVRNKLNFYE
jgi:hypothetical protein